MNSLLLIVFIGILVSFFIGWNNMLEMEFSLEINRWNSPYFNIGVSFNRYDTSDEELIEQELRIGLLFISFVFVFCKEKNDA